MKRNFKALGLALLAAFAMSAVAASVAGATAAQFTAADYPAVGTGIEQGVTGSNFFETTPGRQFHCGTVTYEGTLTGPSTELTMTPHYTNCIITPGNFTANFNINGCHFILTAGTKKTGGSTGQTHLECPTDGPVIIQAATCTVHIPPQTIPVTYTNESNDIRITANFSGLTATETDGFLCPFEGNTHITTGSFISTVTFQGFEDLGTHHATTKDFDGGQHTITTATEGSSVKIDVG